LCSPLKQQLISTTIYNVSEKGHKYINRITIEQHNKRIDCSYSLIYIIERTSATVFSLDADTSYCKITYKSILRGKLVDCQYSKLNAHMGIILPHAQK